MEIHAETLSHRKDRTNVTDPQVWITTHTDTVSHFVGLIFASHHVLI